MSVSEAESQALRDARRRGLARYLLFQIPGWLVSAVVAMGSRSWFGLSDGMALAAWLAWLAKDAALYPLVRRAYEPHPAPEPSAALIGACGITIEPLAPEGYVRLGSELWRAETRPREQSVEAGCRVRVIAVHGLTLHVEAANDDPR